MAAWPLRPKAALERRDGYGRRPRGLHVPAKGSVGGDHAEGTETGILLDHPEDEPVCRLVFP